MQSDPQQEAGSISHIPPTMPAHPSPASVPQTPETPAHPQYQYQQHQQYQPQYQQHQPQYQQYQQYNPQYPPYPSMAGAATQKSALIYGLIGGAIASGIDLAISLFFTYVPVYIGFLEQIYTISLFYALLCSPGFFVAGLLATRKTGKMSSAMLACTLALACFAGVDLCLSVVFSFLFPKPALDLLFNFPIWEPLIESWLLELVFASALGFGVAALGGAIGRKKA